MPDFKPPKPNRFIISLSEYLLPYYLKHVERLSFQFYEGSESPIEFLKGRKVVIVINHSDRQDPLLVVALAKYMHEQFYCVAAREVFDWSYGLLGWLFQRLGCFSVDRGTTDFKSIHTIQKILTHSDHKFVVFPEGEVTGDDHAVHEIGQALMHIFLKAQKEIHSTKSNESIWILPIGVCYRLDSDLQSSVSKTLHRIERQLGIHLEQDTDVTRRTTQALIILLRNLSEHYNFALCERQPQQEQVRLLARHICEHISAYGTVEHDPELSTEQLLHHLRNEILEKSKSKATKSRYQQNLQHNAVPVANSFLKDLDRVERLLILQRVLDQAMSAIQICRIVDFLESETCGRMTAKGRQHASVFFGKPIDVLPFLNDYESNKSAAVHRLRDDVRNALQSALDNSNTELSNTKQRQPSLT